MGIESFDLECEGGCSSRGVMWIFDAEEFDLRKFAESIKELRDAIGFDFLDPLESVIEAL